MIWTTQDETDQPALAAHVYVTPEAKQSNGIGGALVMLAWIWLACKIIEIAGGR